MMLWLFVQRLRRLPVTQGSESWRPRVKLLHRRSRAYRATKRPTTRHQVQLTQVQGVLDCNADALADAQPMVTAPEPTLPSGEPMAFTLSAVYDQEDVEDPDSDADMKDGARF